MQLSDFIIDIANKKIKISDIYKDEALNIKKHGKLLGNMLNNLLPFLSCEYNDFDKIFDNELKKVNRSDILIERSTGKTLEEIGLSLGLTRERVRQIVQKTCSIITPWLQIYLYRKECDELLNRNTLFIDLETVFSDFSIKNITIISLAIKFYDLAYISWIKEYHSFFNKENNNQFDDLLSLLEPEEEIFSLSSKLEEIDRTHPEINIFCCNQTALINYYHKKGFEYKNDKLFSLDITSSKTVLLDHIIKNYFEFGFSLEDDYDELVDILNRDYNRSVKDSDNIRNWFSKTSENLILWGPSQRMHIDNIYLDDSEVEDIFNRFHNYMKTHYSINMSDFYEDNISLFNNTPFANHYALYGFLKYHLSDTYYFKKLSVRSLDKKGNKLAEEIRDYILSEKKINFDTLVDKYSLATINNTISFTSSIIKYNGYVYSYDFFPISSSLVSKIKMIIDEEIENFGYVTSKKLFSIVKDDVNYFGIDDGTLLFDVLKNYLENDFKFFKPYIQPKAGNKPLSLKKVLTEYMNANSYQSISNVENFLISQGLVSINLFNWAISYVFEKIGEKLVKVSKDEVTFESYISIDQDTINQVDDFISYHLSDSDSLLIKKCPSKTFFNKKIWINNKYIDLNPYLLYTIAQKYLYDKYDFFNNISSSSLEEYSEIIVKKGLYNSFEEIVYNKIKNKFTGVTSAYQISNYLINDLLITRKYIPTKVLELLQNDINIEGNYVF